MLIREEFIVAAPHHEAWNFFSNFPDPIKVIPNLTELCQTAPYCYVGGVRVGLGPLNFHFRGNMHIILVDAKTCRVNISGTAQDPQLGGYFQATAYTQTLPHGPHHSRITVDVEIGLGGLLGKLGGLALRPAARRVVEHYRQMVNCELARRQILANPPALKELA